MAWFVPLEGYWINVFIVFTVAAILVTNAVLFRRSGQARGGRFIRPLFRYAMRHRARSGSNSLTAISPKPLSAEEQQQQQQHKQQLQQHQHQHLNADENQAYPVRPSDNEWRREAARWVHRDPNATTRAIVQGWIDSNDQCSAKRLLMGKRLAFGTSGLRGTMGPGYCRMNDLVVIQTTQGLCRYLEEEGGEEFKKRGVVIGRDHRKQGGLSSEGFARLAASVFVSRGFRVYLMDGTVVPTPLVAFGVSHLEACAGVMVTASHNPKKDNGYKVYWGNGSQIIPPRDTGIAASILRNLEPWQKYEPESVTAEPLCSNPIDTVAEAYFRGIGDQLCRRPEANARSGLEVVYSAMHGVADAWTRRAFLRFSLPPFLSVGSQRDPDPEFPTVAFPNPEEPGALKEALALAEEKGVPLVLATDPDGDRLAAAEKQPSGEWHVFSGNEIGVLLGLWQWEEWRRMQPDEDPSKAVMLASTVSSKMLSAAARVEGFTFEETLPGFKWMAHRAQDLKAQGKTILFAYEEAIGFGPGDVVFEKDGLSSAALFCEMFIALRDRDPLEAAAATAAVAPGVVASSVAAASPDTQGEAEGSPQPPLLGGSDCLTAKAIGKTVESDEIFGVSTTAPPSPENVTSSLSPSFALRQLPSSSSLPSVATDAEGDQKQKQQHRKHGLQPSRVSSVLTRRLKALHQRYGEFAEENGYVRCEDVQVVSKIFARLRGDGSYLSQFGGYSVTGVRDLSEEHGFDSESPDSRPMLPVVGGGAHFLTFRLGEAGVVATLRTSGTEPKIKFYVEMQGKPGVPLEEVSASLSKIAAVFVNEALEPERWGMKRVALA